MKSIAGSMVFFLIAIGGFMGCDTQDSCIEVGSNGEFGTDHLEKIELVSNFVHELGFQIPREKVAAILGTAYAASQLEGGQPGVPVRICFRQGSPNGTEYRVLSLSNKPLLDWNSAAGFPAP